MNESVMHVGFGWYDKNKKKDSTCVLVVNLTSLEWALRQR